MAADADAESLFASHQPGGRSHRMSVLPAARPGSRPRLTPRTALMVVHGRLVLDTARFFKGHKTQLLITLKPLR